MVGADTRIKSAAMNDDTGVAVGTLNVLLCVMTCRNILYAERRGKARHATVCRIGTKDRFSHPDLSAQIFTSINKEWSKKYIDNAVFIW